MIEEWDFMRIWQNDMRPRERDGDTERDVPILQDKPKKPREIVNLEEVQPDHPAGLRTRGQVAYHNYKKKQKELKIRRQEEKLQREKDAELRRHQDQDQAEKNERMKQRLSHLELSKLRTRLGELTLFDEDSLSHDDVEVIEPPLEHECLPIELEDPSEELVKSLKEQYDLNNLLKTTINTVEPGPAKMIKLINQKVKHRNKLLEQNLEFGFKDDDFKLEGWTREVDNRSYGVRSQSRLAQRKKEELQKRKDAGEAPTCKLSEEAETSMRGQLAFNKTILRVLNVPLPDPQWEFRHAITLLNDRNRLLKAQLESVGEQPTRGLATMSARRTVYFNAWFDFEQWDF